MEPIGVSLTVRGSGITCPLDVNADNIFSMTLYVNVVNIKGRGPM